MKDSTVENETPDVPWLFCPSLIPRKLNEALGNSRRAGDGVALGLVRVNNCDTVAATFGPEAGFEYLAEIGVLLNRLIRRGDILCRDRDYEFACIMRSNNSEAAHVSFERKIHTLACRPVRIQYQSFYPDISFGFARALHHMTTAAEMLASARKSMQRGPASESRYFRKYTELWGAEEITAEAMT